MPPDRAGAGTRHRGPRFVQAKLYSEAKTAPGGWSSPAAAGRSAQVPGRDGPGHAADSGTNPAALRCAASGATVDNPGDNSYITAVDYPPAGMVASVQVMYARSRSERDIGRSAPVAGRSPYGKCSARHPRQQSTKQSNEHPHSRRSAPRYAQPHGPTLPAVALETRVILI